MLSYRNQKKLNKLLRNPKQFFLDSKYLRFISGVFFVNKKADVAVQGITLVQWGEHFELAKEHDENKLNSRFILLFGFHDWKKGFVHKFLPEFQVIYAKPNVTLKNIETLLVSFGVEALVSWGVNNDPILKNASEKFKLPIWSMEDGFLRSVELGSNHVEPRSLILDKSGIYFDATRPSDLENLLNTWDKHQGKSVLDQAAHLLEVFKYLQLSKYNHPSLSSINSKVNLPIFKKKSILVIGQLSKDASLRYGGCEDMSNEDLIKEAVKDHPNQAIIYKPHPDELKANKKHLDAIRALNLTIEIADNSQPLTQTISDIDHVYTMTSLAGFEALLLDKKVTVFGTPFYAGWGLTEDKVDVPRRGRTLTVPELFAIAYIVYPRYIGQAETPELNFLSAMQTIAAERELAIYKSVAALSKKGDQKLYGTIFWHALLLSNVKEKHDIKLKKIFALGIPFKAIFSEQKSSAHQRFLAYLIGGVGETSPQLSLILTGLRQNLSADMLNDLLSDLWKINPTPARLEHWAHFCEENSRLQEARSSFEFLANVKTLPKGKGRLSSAEMRNQYQLAQFEFRNKKYAAAKRILEIILLSGEVTPTVLDLYGQIAISTFEYSLALEIYTIIKGIDCNWRGGYSFLICARLAALFEDRQQAFINAATACYINPRLICSLPEDTGFTFNKVFKNISFDEAMCNAVHASGRGSVIARAAADISIGDFLRAENALSCYKPEPGERDLWLTLYSQSLSYQEKSEEAKSLISESIEKSRSPVLLREAFRLATQINDYNWIKLLLNFAEKSDAPITEIHKRKAATILGDEKLYYRCLREMGSSEHLKRHFGEKYVQSYRGIEFKSTDRNLVLAYFGPGDEIRWSSTYPSIASMAYPAKVSFTCDPRLLTLLRRSFPLLDFIPVSRVRNLQSLADVELIKNLPGAELFRHMDNRGWSAASNSDYVSLQVDLLADIIDSHDDLSGKPFFIPAPDLVEEWKVRLSGDGVPRKKVGISWRSSVLSTTRNQYYLDVEHVEKIIAAFPDFEFFCLQYDECAEELDWMEKHQPGRLKYFGDIDYFNDFESVSAIIKNLDCVISPGTSIVELAGALGVNSIFFSTTAESDWRYKKESNTDVWHYSVKHIKADSLNNKSALVESIIKYLTTYEVQNAL